MAKVMVKVVKGRGWSGGHFGSKDDASAPFEYDLSSDPQDLRKLGLVEAVETPAPEKSGK